jgi:hypothetical protein
MQSILLDIILQTEIVRKGSEGMGLGSSVGKVSAVWTDGFGFE